MTKKELGDISVLAAIKDQLELGIDDCINVNVTVFIGELAWSVGTFIPRKKWEDYLPEIITEVDTTMENMEASLDDIGESGAYMCLEGYWHDCETPEQAFIGNLMINSCITMGKILYRCDALEHLLAATKTAVLRDAPDSEEYKTLCNIKDLPLDMCGYSDDREDDPDVRVLAIFDDFPPYILDEVYAKLKEAKEKNV